MRPEIYISTAKVADEVLILARTSPCEHVTPPPDGTNLFYIDDHASAHVEVRVIEKINRSAVGPNMLIIDRLPVPEFDRIGAESDGFRVVLHGSIPSAS